MRMQLPVIRYLVLFIALVFTTTTVTADSRSEARARYQAGVKAYSAGDYKAAIKEFSAAQELAPADLNNYNLALCYDKLGEPEPAIQYYRAFLDKQPNSDKRAEIEASVKRLEAAAKSAAAKKAAREKEEEAKRLAEEKKAEEEARKAEEKRLAEEKRKPPVVEDRRPAPPIDEPDTSGIGSTGTPGGGGTVSTGDSQLDRVARIDVNQVRDQRLGGQSSGMMPGQSMPGQSINQRGTGPTAPPAPNGGGDTNAAANIDVNAARGGMPPTAGTQNTAAAAPQPGAPDPSDKPKAKPVYKKWWFWAVLAVSAYVVYSIATEDSNDNSARMLPEVGGGNSPAQTGGGMTLMRW